MLFNRTPLAWKNLTSSWTKLLLSTGGVGFAVLLMFSQIGFRNGLFDSTVQLVRLMDADFIIVSRAKYNLPSEQRFDRSLLRRASQVEGVESVQPIYLERAGTELRVLGRPSRSIRVVGVPLTGRVFADDVMDNRRSEIEMPQSALLDRRTKRMYGLERSNRDRLREQEVELSGRRLTFVDYVEIGTDFVHDGSLVMSDQSFATYFPWRNSGGDPLSTVDFGLVRLNSGSDALRVKEQITALAPNEWDVLSKQQIIDREIHFWGTATPIGIIFSVGTVMGLVVGTIICYQIIFTDISDHMSEFATLKAMGYSRFYFVQLVVGQSLYLTVLGFIPALLLSYYVYQLLTETTGLVMLLTPERVLLVFCLTLLMCLSGGLLAVRKLNASDPANLF
ncbi:MAG: FtsX-like permease family protein [Pirellulaceae bacterium]|nr:FtsX-like permease family protein [Pirellulaceae bacterium]